MRDALALRWCWFPGADVKAAVLLRGITNNDFAVELMRKVNGQCGLAGGSGSEDGD